jgi:hypothetical protein
MPEQIPVFDTPWYAEMIERFRADTGSPGLDALGTAILASACILSQAIDQLTKAVQAGKQPPPPSRPNKRRRQS